MGILDRINQAARSAVTGWLFPDGVVMPDVIQDEKETKRQSLVQRARDYYDGDHKIYLTDRQKAWLDLHSDTDIKFSVNHSATVIDTTVERLKVLGFDLGEEEPAKATAAVLWDWWNDNRMDALQIDTHRSTVRDGEAFILVDWDTDENRPKFLFHPRYVSEGAGGDGFGIWVEYPGNNVYMDPLTAYKRWNDLDEEGKIIQRMNVYYPERVEKYVLRRRKWEPFEVEGEEWPLDWTDDNGEPLGIPVAHFRNPGQKSDLKDVIPLQDALNKAWLDLMAASDTTAFQVLVFFGWLPTKDGKEPKEDGSNLLQIAPGQHTGTKKKPGEASLEIIDPADLRPLLETEERIVLRMSEVSKTPPSRFQVTRQVAAEGTLKQQEGPLIAKVEERQTLFGNAWEDAMLIALRLSSAFGQGEGRQEPEQSLSTMWQSAEIRNEKEDAEIAAKKLQFAIPLRKIWAELGYSAEEIEEMENSEEFRARLANLQLATVTLAEMDAEQS